MKHEVFFGLIFTKNYLLHLEETFLHPLYQRPTGLGADSMVGVSVTQQRVDHGDSAVQSTINIDFIELINKTSSWFHSRKLLLNIYILLGYFLRIVFRI